jgi:hypothetical protein
MLFLVNRITAKNIFIANSLQLHLMAFLQAAGLSVRHVTSAPVERFISVGILANLRRITTASPSNENARTP